MPGEHKSSAVNGEGDGASAIPSTASGAAVMLRSTEELANWLMKVAPRSMLKGLIVRIGATVPTPLMSTVRGPPGPLLIIERVPERRPARVGRNETLTVQVPADASENPQVSVSIKSPLRR